MNTELDQIKTLADNVDAQLDALALAADTLGKQLAAVTADKLALTSQLQAANDLLRATELRAGSPLASLPTVLPELQARADWQQPGNAGDTGGSSTKPSGTFRMTPGPIANFSAKGAYPYNNGYWFVRLGPQPNATRFFYEFAVQLPTNADLAASQAIEFELQQTDKGVVYNMAWQAPFKGSKFWRTFDYANHAWLDTSVPLDATLFADGKWVDIAAEFKRTGDQVQHVALTINETRYDLAGIVRAGVKRYDASANSFNAAFQLDSTKTFPPYQANVERMRVHFL